MVAGEIEVHQRTKRVGFAASGRAVCRHGKASAAFAIGGDIRLNKACALRIQRLLEDVRPCGRPRSDPVSCFNIKPASLGDHRLIGGYISCDAVI
jgi:hypothetical protein